jgi:hypothetical protein
MPLLRGSSRDVIQENIRILRGEGVPEDQAIAMAMEEARRSAKKGADAPSRPKG